MSRHNGAVACSVVGPTNFHRPRDKCRGNRGQNYRRERRRNLLSLDQRKRCLRDHLRKWVSAYIELDDRTPTPQAVIYALNAKPHKAKGVGMTLTKAELISQNRGEIALQISVSRLNGQRFTVTWREHYSRFLSPELQYVAQRVEASLRNRISMVA